MRILYGVPSEGMGHATRTKIIVEYLLGQGHDVRMVSSDGAFKFLEECFPQRCFEIKGFHIQMKEDRVSKTQTIKEILSGAPSSLKKNISQMQTVFKDFAPEVVISDFESFTFFYAKIHSLPLLSLDNIQFLDRFALDFEIPATRKSEAKMTQRIVSWKVPFAKKYLVSTFVNAEILKENTIAIPPILRQEIIDLKPSYGDHHLVYMRSSDMQKTIQEFQKLPQEKFVWYQNVEQIEHFDNVEVRPFDQSSFMENLASARSVITLGGYSMISEAVYLHKPVFSMPMHGQFEQYVNGALIESNGYGRCFDELNGDNLKAFLWDWDVFAKNLESYQQDGNQKTFKILTKSLAELVK